MKKMLWVLFLCIPACEGVQYFPDAPPASDTDMMCQEDEPCWDCHTMGNGICGPDHG